MGRLCYISRNYYNFASAGNKAKSDNEDTLQSLGAVNLGLRRSCHNSKVVAFFRNFAGVVKFALCVRRGDIVVLQYPVKKYFKLLCRVARAKGAKTVALIHDLGSFRRRAITTATEIARLSQADCVVASNAAMERWLKENGLKKPTCWLGLFDYLSPSRPQKEALPVGGEWQIVYAGSLNMRKNAFLTKMQQLDMRFALNLYGRPSDYGIDRSKAHIVEHEFMPSDRFIAEAEGHFGLIWDGDSLDGCTGSFGEYLKYNSPHKLSFYVRAGLPVIVWDKAAVAPIVESEGIGLVVASLRDVPAALASVDEARMEAMRRNVARVSDRLASGQYFKDALAKAEAKL